MGKKPQCFAYKDKYYWNGVWYFGHPKAQFNSQMCLSLLKVTLVEQEHQVSSTAPPAGGHGLRSPDGGSEAELPPFPRKAVSKPCYRHQLRTALKLFISHLPSAPASSPVPFRWTQSLWSQPRISCLLLQFVNNCGDTLTVTVTVYRTQLPDAFYYSLEFFFSLLNVY